MSILVSNLLLPNRRTINSFFSQNSGCLQTSVVECGAIPVLLVALDSPKQSVRDECVKCLSAIIASSSYHRDCLIQEGGLTAL